MPDSPTFRHLRKGYTLSVHTASVGGDVRDTQSNAVHVQTAGSEKFKSDLPSTSVDSCWWCNSCCMILKKPESRRKVSPVSAFLPRVSCLSPASAFRHQGSIRYRWSQIYSGVAQLCHSHIYTFTMYARRQQITGALLKKENSRQTGSVCTGQSGSSYPIPFNSLKFRKRVVCCNNNTTFLEPASYEPASPTSVIFPSAASQDSLTCVPYKRSLGITLALPLQ